MIINMILYISPYRHQYGESVSFRLVRSIRSSTWRASLVHRTAEDHDAYEGQQWQLVRLVFYDHAFLMRTRKVSSQASGKIYLLVPERLLRPIRR